MTRAVRIGNAQAFWGDRSDAAAQLVEREPHLDYLTLDYLAEVSMSILVQQRAQDPAAGYARDFLEVVKSLAPYWARGGRCRLITNAGGLNPQGCAAACVAALAAAGCPALTVAVVTGDDVLPTIQSQADSDADLATFANLDTGQPIRAVAAQLITASAYLGSAGIVEALRQGADLVITGRVADPSLVAAACAHHFDWSLDEWDRLAGATVAGHLIECGTQVTGGICTDWLDVPESADIGFPIVEVAADGSCVVTKPGGSGGWVTEATVKEQLVYEILDPSAYLSPDVTVSFLSLRVDEVGADRVRVSGARGRPAPSRYKVSATYLDGYRAAGTLTIVGRDAAAKARRCGEIVLQRVRAAGFSLRDSVIECLGTGDCWPNELRPAPSPDRHGEVVLRIAVEAESREAVERFARELMPQVTAGPQGTTGYAAGRPHVQRVVRYWPCLVDRELAQPEVRIVSQARVERNQPAGADTASRTPTAEHRLGEAALAAQVPGPSDRRLWSLARARSGDKGMHANVGVLARSEAAYRTLVRELTADRVREFFRSLGAEAVVRYEMPSLLALNFVVRGILRRSLRTDAQGKALGQILLEMPIDTWQVD